MMEIQFDAVDGVIFDANVIGNTSSGYEKSRASITDCTLHFKEERRRTTKSRSKFQKKEREVWIGG